jgi:hypothetical protein
MLNMLENIKEMSLRHTSADFLLEFGQPFWLDACHQFLEVWRSIFVDIQLAVGGKARVGLGGGGRQFNLQDGGDVHAALRYTEGSAVGRQSCFTFRPGKELGAIVSKFLCADDDVEITGLQCLSKIVKDTDLKCTSVRSGMIPLALNDKPLPALRRRAGFSP